MKEEMPARMAAMLPPQEESTCVLDMRGLNNKMQTAGCKKDGCHRG
jgi:hypothetical protein